MPIYTGKSADGTDAKMFKGMYTSPNKKYWGSKPISLEEEKEIDKALAGTRFEVKTKQRKKK